MSRLEQLRGRYGERLPQRLDALRAALAAAIRGAPDSPAVSEAIALAHRLAGTAGTYGFAQVAQLGADCERRLREYQQHGIALPGWDALMARPPQHEDRSAAVTAAPAANFPADSPSDAAGRILVIDDDEDFLAVIAAALREGGYTPTTTAGTRGLGSLIESTRPDLILLDVEMPEASGFTLCQAIRRDERWRDTPIVFLTGRSATEDRIAAFQTGADDFITKPVVVAELRARVDVRVERGRLARERKALLEQARQQRDSLLALLDQLQIGTVLLDGAGRIEFISRYCGQIGLDPEAGIGAPWHTALPLDPAGRRRLETQLSLAAEERTRLTLTWTKEDRQYVVECEVRNVPAVEGQRIVCLTDVSELHRLRRELDQSRYGRMVGNSLPMRELYRLIGEVARGDWTVLIEGETGTGKELVAHAIHAASPRNAGPFIAVNSAGLSESLLASQLFGHRKGAFTGAVADQEGFFDAAHGGTLFLDEIGDLPLSMQASLLRVLQEKEITRLGETRVRKVDVRVLAATHKDLASEARAGRFREDLLYRLRVARVYVPALRERESDIPLLAKAFLAGSYQVSGRAQPRIGTEATQCLCSYPWPGNVRELKAAIDYAVIHCRGEWIAHEDLPPEIVQNPAPTVPPEPIPADGDERSRILAALARTAGNRLQAAKLLGISRATFYRRLARLGISEDQQASRQT